jgi:GT2 family glycosyltransferase
MKNGSQQPLVSIITVNYNGIDYLDDLYQSLTKVTYPNCELILVDNASADGSVQFVKDNYPEVRIIENPDNYLFARGNNVGIRAAKGEIICLLNNDVKVSPDFLEIIVQEFEENQEMAACQPKVLDLNRPDCFEYAGACGGYLDKFGYPFMRGRLFFTLEDDRGQYDTVQEIFWCTGACFFIRRSVLDSVGFLDEEFGMHMEEIDLCWRMHLNRFKIYCVPAARVWHKGGGTLKTDDPRKIYWNFRNNIFLLVKNLAMFNLIRIIVVRLGLDGIAATRELLKSNMAGSLAILKSYLWILLNIFMVGRKRAEIQRQRKATDREVFRLIYPGSIVWEYFVLHRTQFSNLKKIDQFLSINLKE